MKPKKHKMIFGRRVLDYEPDNLKSPRALNKHDNYSDYQQANSSLLSSSETYQKKSSRKGGKVLTSKRKTFKRKLPSKWRVRRFTERSNKTINEKNNLNRTQHLQSMETKTKKRSLWNHSQSNIRSSFNPFNSKTRNSPKLVISDIIGQKPVEKHQLWISSLSRNRNSSRVIGEAGHPDPYLNMSSFNISDDISHIIPSFSSKVRGKEFLQRMKGDSSNRESVISQSNFLKNNQSISAIEPDNHSYRFINKDDPNSFLEEIAPEMDLQINLYENSAGGSTTNKTLNKKMPRASLDEKINPRFNSSCNTLQFNSNEFTKRVMNHKKNNPSLDVTNTPQSRIILPKLRQFSQQNNIISGISKINIILIKDHLSDHKLDIKMHVPPMNLYQKHSVTSSNHSSFFFRKYL